MEVLVGIFNQEKVLVGAFSVIVKLRVIIAKVRLQLCHLVCLMGTGVSGMVARYLSSCTLKLSALSDL